jgi:hypothetical protein
MIDCSRSRRDTDSDATCVAPRAAGRRLATMQLSSGSDDDRLSVGHVREQLYNRGHRLRSRDRDEGDLHAVLQQYRVHATISGCVEIPRQLFWLTQTSVMNPGCGGDSHPPMRPSRVSLRAQRSNLRRLRPIRGLPRCVRAQTIHGQCRRLQHNRSQPVKRLTPPASGMLRSGSDHRCGLFARIAHVDTMCPLSPATLAMSLNVIVVLSDRVIVVAPPLEVARLSATPAATAP